MRPKNPSIDRILNHTKMIFLLTIFLSMGCLSATESCDIPSFLNPTSDEKTQPHFHKTEDRNKVGSFREALTKNGCFEGAVYFGTGAALETLSLLARLGGEVTLVSPYSAGNEWHLFSRLCDVAAKRSFAQVFKRSKTSSSLFNKVPFSHQSWYLNQTQLSQIPAFSEQERKLLSFLEKRWLAKSAGFYPSIVDWVCPCFGVTVQIHPDSTNTYARDPVHKFPQFPESYKKAVDSWKELLPHPRDFPLILTRPYDLQDYLPCCIKVFHGEKIQSAVEKIALKIQSTDSKVLVDLTEIFSNETYDQENWLQNWNSYKAPFSQACKDHHLDLNQIFCIQRVVNEEIGGIRVLPLFGSSLEELEAPHRFLLGWVSMFGLSANRIELDRWNLPTQTANATPSLSIECQSKEAFLSSLDSFEKNWKSSNPQKILMIKGATQVLKGLFASLKEDKWQEIENCPTRSLVVQLSFIKIQEQFKLLLEEEEGALFFDTVSHAEQIHANLSALIEILSPFNYEDFSSIYHCLLNSIPPDLKQFTTCGIHSSGMTSLSGIFKAMERALGRSPRVLCGGNTYFENVHAAKRISHATKIEEVTEKDWGEFELILAQFNPVLRRFDSIGAEYKLENISEVLNKTLKARKGNPVTIAIDCTLDFIDSPRVGRLLSEFQEEIERGMLNVVCYRSGLKFDLFGMDNYCGAPFYMIHNQDSKWDSFKALTHDQVLQNDRLSVNWFCLAYQNAASQLDLYRKQIFDNTRALLHKTPLNLLNNKNANYRVVPIAEDADATFIDIKISGPLHKIRGSALVGGAITMECMDNGHPIFYRQSMGFYHPNFSIIFAKDCTTLRLTLGIDPSQVDLLAMCFEKIDLLNASSGQTIIDKVLKSASFPLFSKGKEKNLKALPISQ